MCQTFSAHFVTESLLTKSENPPRMTTIMFPRERLANILDCCISGILRRARPQHSKMSKQSGSKEELARIKRSQTRGSQLPTPCMAGMQWNLQGRIPLFQLSSPKIRWVLPLLPRTSSISHNYAITVEASRPEEASRLRDQAKQGRSWAGCVKLASSKFFGTTCQDPVCAQHPLCPKG